MPDVATIRERMWSTPGKYIRLLTHPSHISPFWNLVRASPDTPMFSHLIWGIKMTFKKVENPKTQTYKLRMSQDDYDAISQKASDCGLSMAEYMRRCAMGRQTRSYIDTQIINELRRLGGLQKHLYKGDQDHSKEYSEVLVAIKEAIKSISVRPNRNSEAEQKIE